MYELESMMRALQKMDGKTRSRQMTDDEFDAMLDDVRSLGIPDVVV